MNFLRTLLNGIWRRAGIEEEMSEEVKFHIESRAAELERRGMPRGEAERHARVEFGGIEGYKERCREALGFRLLDDLLGDIRYSFRTLRKSAFTPVAVLSLALGIGVNLSCFAALYAMVMRPFPYPELDRIVMLSETRANAPAERDPVAPANYLDWKQQSRSFESMAAFREWEANITGVDRPDHIHASQASSDFFPILGLPPALGRTFTATECEPGKDRVVVVSYGFWKARLHGTPDAIGKTISLNGRNYSVIGIMPDEFNLPLSAELWAPLALSPTERAEREIGQLSVVAKLKAGLTGTRAAAEMDSIARSIDLLHPRTNEQRRVHTSAFADLVQKESAHFISVLTCAALFVLLLACTNVGSLQVARALSREKEIGLRSALGASRYRLMRQLLTESVMVGLAAGAVGLVLAVWDLRAARADIPAMVYRWVPGIREMRLNVEVAAWGIFLSLVTGVVCCLPAFIQLMRSRTVADVNEVLKGGARGTTAPARHHLRNALVVAEIALAFILMVGAGLMTGTFQRLVNVNLGYDSSNVLTAHLTLSGAEYEKPSSVVSFHDRLLKNIGQTPGVDAMGAIAQLDTAHSISIEGRASLRAGELRPAINAATPQYQRAIRLPVLQGRWISDEDRTDSQPVAVISASVARHYWPGRDPIGRRMLFSNLDSRWLTVVGVSGDVNDWFIGQPIPVVYVAFRQFPVASMELFLRASGDSSKLAPALRAAAESIDREQPLYEVRTIEQHMYAETSGIRNAARMMNVYAIIALILAVTGIYSISSFFVAQWTREIGVRISLGATRGSILGIVMSQASVTTGLGLLIGAPVAVLLTIGMSRALFNLVAIQPLTFVWFVMLLGGAALAASCIPAYRAAKIDPATTLRSE